MSTTTDSGDARSRAAKSPDAFRTISEVAADLDVPQHVLRFWETKFSQIRPLKRGGGRRYYRPEDVDLLRRIRTLLYGEGYTIKGVQKVLREGGRTAIEVGGTRAAAADAPETRPEAETASLDFDEVVEEDVEVDGESSAAADDHAAPDEAPETEATVHHEALGPEEHERLAELKHELLELKTLLGEALGPRRTS